MSLSSLLKGKEKTYKADPLAADINAAGKQGLDYLKSGASALNNVYSQDPTQYVNSQISLENKVARGAADDATRRTRELVARRGIGNSSIGLGQEVNNRQNALDKISTNNASGISRLRDAQIQNGQGLVNTGNTLYGIKAAQGIQMQDVKTRSGGIAGLLGTAAGAGVGGMIGGPQGAQMGAQIGGSLGNAYQNS